MVRLIDGILYVRASGGFSKEVAIENSNEMQISDFKHRNGVLTLTINFVKGILRIKRRLELEASSKYGLTNITDKYLPHKILC